MTMSSALSNAKLRATIHHTKTVFLQYYAFIVFFNTFDKIGVVIRTINLFIHLAPEFINDSFDFFSNQPKLYSSHGCTLHESCN